MENQSVFLVSCVVIFILLCVSWSSEMRFGERRGNKLPAEPQTAFQHVFLSLSPKAFHINSWFKCLVLGLLFDFRSVLWSISFTLFLLTHIVIISAAAECDCRNVRPDLRAYRNKHRTRFSNFFHAASLPVTHFVWISKFCAAVVRINRKRGEYCFFCCHNQTQRQTDQKTAGAGTLLL